MLLKERVAVITGSGRGIGRAIALKFAAQGASVVISARTESEINAVTAETASRGGSAMAIRADMAEHSSCENPIRACETRFGRVDILVNNAGEYGPVKPVKKSFPRNGIT